MTLSATALQFVSLVPTGLYLKGEGFNATLKLLMGIYLQLFMFLLAELTRYVTLLRLFK